MTDAEIQIFETLAKTLMDGLIQYWKDKAAGGSASAKATLDDVIAKAGSAAADLPGADKVSDVVADKALDDKFDTEPNK